VNKEVVEYYSGFLEGLLNYVVKEAAYEKTLYVIKWTELTPRD
jgi:hypothetical protein